MHAEDYYSVLGVERAATQQEIRKAFRRLVRRLHPDGADGAEADTERLCEVLEAYSVLGHPHRRAVYDQALRREEAASPLWADFPPPRTHATRRQSVFDDPDLLWRIFRWPS